MTNDGPSRGWQHKLERAAVHLETLQELVDTFVAVAGLEVVLEEQRQPIPHQVLVFRSRADLPTDLGLVIGDCVHNLRCALDHVFWALPRNPPPTPRYQRRILFPITDRQDLAADVTRTLSPQLAAIVHEAQPYNRLYPEMGIFTSWLGPMIDGREQTDHPLDILQRLSNADKHRELVLAATGYWHMTWSGASRQPRVNRGAWKHGDVVVEFAPEDRISGASANFDVVFAEGPPGYGLRVTQTLSRVEDFVRTVVGRLERGS